MRLVKGLLDRSLNTLELLAVEASWLRLSDMANRLQVQKGAMHRLLNELVDYGWVEQNAETDRYRLTLKLALLGQQFLHGSALSGLVQPILDELAGRCGELVRLTVIDGEELAWLAASQGARPGLMYQPTMQGKVALHATANGKAWLATMDDKNAIRHALRNGMGNKGAYGPNALTRVEALLEELATTRRRGYGVSTEEAEPGVNAIAVALRLPLEDRIIGTMSIAGPMQRLHKKRFPEMHAMLSAAAATLQRVWPLQTSTLLKSA